MRVIAEASSFDVTPAPWLLAWTVLTMLCLIGGLITAAKARWGWLLVGLLTGGLAWLFTAFQLAAPGSLWSRAFYGPEKRARAYRALVPEAPSPLR